MNKYNLMQIINLFPLTIVKEKILIQENERQQLVNEIKKMKQQDKEQQQNTNAWTGDTKGYEFLFSNKLYSDLSKKTFFSERTYFFSESRNYSF